MAYHAEKYITKCLDSILSQTYTDYKVIVVLDDYKYDRTYDLIRNHTLTLKGKLSLRYRDFKTSPAIARNHALELVSGDYIAFIDADDWWEPEKLERQVKLLEDNPYFDLCYTYGAWDFPNGRTEIHGVKSGKVPVKLVCIAPHSSILIRTRMRIPVFDPTLKACDDYKWLLDLDDLDCKFVSINEPLTHMTIHDTNLTTGKLGFITQTMEVHKLRGEYWLAMFKLVMGTILLIKRSLFRRFDIDGLGEELGLTT